MEFSSDPIRRLATKLAVLKVLVLENFPFTVLATFEIRVSVYDGTGKR